MTTPTAGRANLFQTKSPEEIDRINAEFYGKFPYPWRSMRVDRALDQDFERVMLCQSIGDYSHRVVPVKPRIWVAGCGTNQALITALNFPTAKVIGSDLSAPSLNLCSRTAQELDVSNIEFRQENLNHVLYREEFDYVLCTGVIHHNANPAVALKRLSDALKPDGILELMVYNRYHRSLTTSFQEAIRLMAGSAVDPGSTSEMKLATSLIRSFPRECQMKDFLEAFQDAPLEHVADALMQPLECSYTLQTLREMARLCGLEICVPCINVFDKLRQGWNWNLSFSSQEVNGMYYALDDLERWQVTNLLLSECSPMLWFYLKRANPSNARKQEHEICEDFLARRFVPASTRRQGYVLNQDGKYQALPATTGYPGTPETPALRRVVETADGRLSMRELFKQHGCATSFPEVNETRLRLTTAAYPFLKAV